jgi:hypothetical protein
MFLVLSPENAMLLQDGAIVVSFVAAGLVAIYFLRRIHLFARWRERRTSDREAEAAAAESMARRSRFEPAEASRPRFLPAAETDMALQAERVRELQGVAEKQLDAAQYALNRLIDDLKAVMPALRGEPSPVIRLPEPKRVSRGQALAA